MTKDSYKGTRIGMEVIILIFFGIFLIPIINLYYWAGFFIVPVAAAITAFILSNKVNDNNTKYLDLVNIILAFAAIIPFIGYISRIAGIVLAIIALANISKIK